MPTAPQIVLFELAGDRAGGLAERLRMQGYAVVVATDALEGARTALAEPPAAVIADLWMPSISGVQLCRLLRAEPATENVPVILRGPESPRNRFWAERAGAADYVITGRMGDLARSLARAITENPPGEGFFTAFPNGGEDIRERIAAHLDAALFESVLASEVRALGTCGAFDRLFDLLTQFVSRVIPYRWLAVSTQAPLRFGLHANPATRASAEREARTALGVPGEVAPVTVEDDDAFDDPEGRPVIIRPLELGGLFIGRMALAPRFQEDAQDERFASVIARELAGPIRMALLVEESQRLATVDALTGLLNRRAFTASLEQEVERSNRYGNRLSLVLFDVDHFKDVNDKHGHQCGDAVLAAIGRHVSGAARRTDLAARWGGEEFVIALTETDQAGARPICERLRTGLESLQVLSEANERIPVTASFGVARLGANDTVSALVARADQAMYAAKHGGRNRVVVAGDEPRPGPQLVAAG